MSTRKENTRMNLTLDEADIRAKQLAKANALGWPQCPDQYAYNDRPLWAAWKKLGESLYAARLLSYADGAALYALAAAYKTQQQDLYKQIYAETWENRKPFPDPNPAPEFDLQNFIVSVKLERATFAERMHATETVCWVNGAAYDWPEGKPATIARQYALDLTQGQAVAGELMRRAAARFIKDLETGHTRGLFFDPVAAAHIVHFAERFCDLQLLPWQVFVLANIFGWKKPTGARRFTEAWVSCAKKNGKTRLASTVALFGLICDDERYPDIFSAATKKEQARLVWRDGKRAVQDNSELRAHVQRWAGALHVPETDGSFTPLSSDEKSMDGLRPHIIIADEVAFWGDRDQWDKLTKGTVSRVSPLTFAITTAGANKFCFAFGKFDLAEKILRGIYNDDSTFVAIFSIDKDDDPLDDKCWPKANPSLGVTLRIEHLQKTCEEVRQDGSGKNAWLQYHCNIWPDVSLMRQGSISVTRWAACSGLEMFPGLGSMEAIKHFIEINRETRCWAGVDVGLTSDLTAVLSYFPKCRVEEGGPLTNRKAIFVQFFAPEIGLLEKEKSWGVPLSQWAREGWLDLTPGDLMDVRLVRDYIISTLKRTFNINEIGFDPWAFQVPAAEISSSGLTCVAVPQTYKELTTPCRELLQSVNDGTLMHFNNPMLAWMAGNVVLEENDKHSGVKPEKLSHNEKIDGISALVTAIHRSMAAPPPSVYLERGIVYV